MRARRLVLASSALVLFSGDAATAQQSQHPPSLVDAQTIVDLAQRDLPDLDHLVDSVMGSRMASEHIPGAAVLVLYKGKILLERGYGVADLASHRRVDPRTTLWPFASITKVFTATAVVQLAARGRIDLTKDANRYLSSVHIPRASWPPITVANLLTHTDALDELPGRQAPSRAMVQPLDQFLRDRLVRFGPPGTVTRYGTYGVATLGVLIQDVSGDSYEHYLARNLFGPLCPQQKGHAGGGRSRVVPHDAHLLARKHS